MSNQSRQVMIRALAKEQRQRRRAKRRNAALRTGSILSQVGIGKRLGTRAYLARKSRKVAVPTPKPPISTPKPGHRTASRSGWRRTWKGIQDRLGALLPQKRATKRPEK